MHGSHNTVQLTFRIYVIIVYTHEHNDVLEPVGTSLNQPVHESSAASARLIFKIHNLCKYPWKQASQGLTLQRKLAAPDGDLGLVRLVICRTGTLYSYNCCFLCNVVSRYILVIILVHSITFWS
jgi:hypothetical protein